MKAARGGYYLVLQVNINMLVLSKNPSETGLFGLASK
jgi:hypothetical protein